MRRIQVPLREEWREKVSRAGMLWPEETKPDGTVLPWWAEGSAYELDLAEIDALEETTTELWAMCLEAARYLATGAMGPIGIPDWALAGARASMEQDPPSLYARFDLRYDGTGPAKLLELNGDTPTMLVESAVAQYHWLTELFPERDQWNSLHERLVATWAAMRPRLAPGPVHFVGVLDEVEEGATLAYVRDTCEQAGYDTVILQIADLGWHTGQQTFVDHENQPVRTCFKLYPWEDLFAEPFHPYLQPTPSVTTGTQWVEPWWKTLLSTKALLAALWRLYPDHPNLLPAYLDGPRGLREWVAKPLHGREGASIRIHADGVEETHAGEYGPEGWCWQQWCPLPDIDGNRPVLGSWVVDGMPAGLGIRESDGHITDGDARFVPHLIDAPAPSVQQVADWLAEDGIPVGAEHQH
ncbi:glutathionylspermidine synthase family protein [Luteipulveratus sp. YIM 133132]|uniref:glutathionylspermidine synthase family protein n=1 Tax=Luteipulveratus flavus TaxID=3031728 RepID=UPI0023AF2150|nr:glutathionylspermidine synthase family protein [Luteipulveratus sp. YIM 133132]MDE9366407.1 glutathionylspermidine synthase family protein [Luteipulveratus sp. YIM 133132]